MDDVHRKVAVKNKEPPYGRFNMAVDYRKQRPAMVGIYAGSVYHQHHSIYINIHTKPKLL